MKYKVLMCNDIAVDLSRLTSGVFATDLPHLWPSDTTMDNLLSGFNFVYPEAQNSLATANLNKCRLVDVELTFYR
jgi:hypothetical protein